VFMVASLIAGMVGCAAGSTVNRVSRFAAGSGTTVSPYQIADWHHLDSMRSYRRKHFVLLNDLDATTAGYAEIAGPAANGGEGWRPIGAWDPYDYGGYLGFTGTLDGQGYEIRDMFIDRADRGEAGLFGYVAPAGVVKNVGVVNASVTGEREIGALAAHNDGNVVNCYSSGNMAGDWWVGGLVGANYDGTVHDCYSMANVTGKYGEAGGLVGRNRGAISNSYATGSVTGRSSIGGLVGDNDTGIVSNCYSGASVTGADGVGGLVGTTWLGGGTIFNSHYNYDEVLINGADVITIGALFGEDFEEWLANGRFLDIDGRLAQQDGYYVIEDVRDFKQLLIFGQDASLRFRLDDDLDLTADTNLYIPYLAGEFHGNGHKVSNLSFHSDFVSQVGLFGYLAGGRVSAVGVENADITGRNYVGGLVGYIREGTVSNSYAEGDVAGHQQVGGLVGENYEGIVDNCYSRGSVTGGGAVGGLLGYLREGTVSNSYSRASVSGGQWVGGLVGTVLPAGAVSNCYAGGNVTGERFVGGLVGLAVRPDKVRDSFWDVETSGMAVSSGGVGKTTAELRDHATFLAVGWDITAVAPGETDPAHVWNIISGQTYPFLSWEPVS